MKKTIAILGIDGTGKSSVIKNLQQMMGDNCVIQYMGYRSFDSNLLNIIQKNITETKSVKNHLLCWFQVILIYIIYLKRYWKNVSTGKYVIFDRYVHEIYINCGEKQKRIYKFLYKKMYPSPKMIVYLYCPAEVSLSRKDDIPDEQVFKAMKKRFDNLFISNEATLSLDSSIYDSETLAKIIMEHISVIFKYKDEKL